jgi:hypothetical protein
MDSARRQRDLAEPGRARRQRDEVPLGGVRERPSRWTPKIYYARGGFR